MTRLRALGPGAVRAIQVQRARQRRLVGLNRLYPFFHLNRDQFLPSYHTRSNAESTFSAIKRKFGDTIRSKTRTAQINEALLKVVCHNIVCLIHEIHENGVTAAFPMLSVQPATE